MWNVKPEQGRLLLSAVRATVVVALLCALAACKQDAADDAAATPADQAAASGEPAAPVEAVSAEVASMDADALRAAASAALREQRLYAPAGNNAMEYYLALRDKQPQDPSVSSALTDLMPYTLIATEQSIGREDFDEAQRLYALMEKTNPDAPALPRLSQTIAAGRQEVVARAAEELPAGVSVEVDHATGDVHLLRGPHYLGIQFHAESILTEHGYDLIHDLVLELLR